MEINNLKNVILEQKIVSNKNGKSKLFISSNMANHKIYQMESNQDSFMELESITLDDYFEKINLLHKINFVKVDVEGAEYLVFNGMKKILSDNKKIKIFTEFMFDLIKISGAEPRDIVKLFTDENFNIQFVNSTKNHLELADLNILTTKRYSKGTVNLFCQRNQ